MTINEACLLLEAHDVTNGATSYFYRGEYHDEAQDVTLELLNNIDGGKYPTIQVLLDSDDLYDLASEYADSNTPIYNSDRAEWFSTNWQAVDEYVDEMGSSEYSNIMNFIGASYCYTLRNEVMECLQKLAEYDNTTA